MAKKEEGIPLARKKTRAEFEKELFDLVGDAYELRSEYQNNTTEVRLYHKECNQEFQRTPKYFLSGHYCPTCCVSPNKGNTQKKTAAQFRQEVFDLVGTEYEVLGEYQSNKKPIEMKHNAAGCDCQYFVTPANFLFSNHRCPACYGSGVGTTDAFKERVYALVGDEYEVVGEYVNSSTKIDLLHHACGNIYDVSPSHFIHSGRRCRHCNGGVKYSKEEFLAMLKEKMGDDYTLVGSYNGMLNQTTFKHLSCGHVWESSPCNHIHADSGCPECRSPQSHGEEVVQETLKSYEDLIITRQFVADDCRNIRVLPFDFSVSKKESTQPDLLIEYDGEQHFEPIEWFGGAETFRRQQENDRIKNRYCEEKHIPLLRIPYWEKQNVADIVVKTLKELQLAS